MVPDTPDGFQSAASAGGHPRQDQTRFGGAPSANAVVKSALAGIVSWFHCDGGSPAPQEQST